jgi:hypothetical protein
MLKATITNYQRFIKEIDNYSKRKTKAGFDAVRIVGFETRKELQKQIEAGALPGQQTGLTELAKRSRSPSMRSKPPLFKLAKGIRYDIDKSPNRLKMDIGFVGRTSASWKRIAYKQQQGITFGADEPHLLRGQNAGMTHRSYLARIGSGKKGRQVYALKAETTTLKLPSRPLVRPFWARFMPKASRKIDEYFERKMRGERI